LSEVYSVYVYIFFQNCFVTCNVSVFLLKFLKGCRGGALGCQKHFPFYVWYFSWFSEKRKFPSKYA